MTKALQQAVRATATPFQRAEMEVIQEQIDLLRGKLIRLTDVKDQRVAEALALSSGSASSTGAGSSSDRMPSTRF